MSRPGLTVELLRDTLARVTRASEAIEDGDPQFAVTTLNDLAADLWSVIADVERPPRRRRERTS